MIAFIDLAEQQRRIRAGIDARICKVLDHGGYIMGPEVAELETALATFCGARHCITCANGTDALQIALMALGIGGANDAVIVPAFTFAATAEAPCLVGATPVFADIDLATYNMEPASLQRCIQAAKEHGLNPKAIIAVDMFGLPAPYPAIRDIADENGLILIGDSAQGFGGLIDGRMTGTFAQITTTSFFPAKPLGCYGDGGALFTDDSDLAKLLDSLRVHGKGAEKYENIRVGTNSRLDTLQAAVLLEKLAIYAEELDARDRIARRYSAALGQRFAAPRPPEGYRSIWAQYTLRASSMEERDAAMSKLKAKNIPTMVYYPRPLHQQSAYQGHPKDPLGLLQSEWASQTVFSLPMHPYLSEADQDQIISALL